MQCDFPKQRVIFESTMLYFRDIFRYDKLGEKFPAHDKTRGKWIR